MTGGTIYYWAGTGATIFYLAGAGATILLWPAAAAISLAGAIGPDYSAAPKGGKSRFFGGWRH